MLIINGKIITVTGETINDGYVYIKENKIFDYGKMCDLAEYGHMAEVIDVKSNYVLPGFVDGHCHVGIMEDSIGIEGKDHNESSDPITPHMRASDGIYFNDISFKEALENGVTTVVVGPGSSNVIGGQFAALKTFGNQIEEMIIKEPVAMKAALGENPKTVFGNMKKLPKTRMATANLLRETLRKAKAYNDTFEGSSNKEIIKFDEKLEALKGVIKREIPLKIHAHREDDILTGIRIAKEFDIRVIIVHCTSGVKIKDILAKEKIPTMVGPLLIHRFRSEHKDLRLDTPSILSDMLIPVALISDHPWVPTKHLSLCASVAVREGLSEVEAIKAITINPAVMLGIDNRVGSIAKDKDADLIVFDGNPLDTRSKVMMTIINGKIVYKR